MKKIYIYVVAAFLAVAQGNMMGQDRKQPVAGPAPEVHITKPTTFKLKNGLKVMLVPNAKLPRVSYSLTIDNPVVLEADKTGVSSILSGMLGGNTVKLDKEQFNEQIDFLGVRMSFSSSGASASGLSKYNKEIVNLLKQGALDPVFTQEEFDKAKAQDIEGIKTMDKSVTAIERRVENALLYGKNTPVGEFSTQETLANVELNDVKDFYKKYFIPQNAYLVVVGDIDLKATEKLIRENFESWGKQDTKFSEYNFANNVAKTQIDFVDMSNAVQSEIALVNQVELKMKDKDYFAALLANQVLGGGGEGRLFLNLREAHGWTYGAYSSISTARNYPGKFRAAASVRNVVTDSAITEFIKEIDLMRNTLVSKEELDMAKAKFIGNFVMEIQKPATIARYALFSALYDLPADFYENYIKNIQSVTAQDIQKAAQKYFLSENLRIVVVGKASDVLQGLETLGLPINYYNTQADPTSKPDTDLSAPSGVSLEGVLNNYLKAIGGKQNLENVKSIYTQAVASVQGMDIEFTSKIMPGYSLLTQSLGGNVLSKIVVTPDKGYMVNQGAQVPLDADQLAQAQKDAYPFIELKWLTNPQVTLGQVKQIQGKNCVGIIDGKTTHYYDLETGLKLSIETLNDINPGLNTVVQLSNYKSVDGILVPFTQIMSMGIDIEIETQNVQINENVSEQDFN
ncbi:M16 family metallopeptidase [Myroides sp. LJL119]